MILLRELKHTKVNKYKMLILQFEAVIINLNEFDCDMRFSTLPATWNNGSLEKSSTCTESGLMVYTCRECKKVKSAAFPASEHDFEANGLLILKRLSVCPGKNHVIAKIVRKL